MDEQSHAADSNWGITGPHVMVFNAVAMMTGYPDSAAPKPTKPHAMVRTRPVPT